MSSPVLPGQDTRAALQQISANITRCLSLWGRIMTLCQARPSMSTGIIREKSLDLEDTLRRGVVTVVDVPNVLPRAKAAFDSGDEISREQLRRIQESQQNLIQTLDDIAGQLTLAFAPQATPTKGPRRTPNPERVLDIDTIWSLVDSVNTQVDNTFGALQGLKGRVHILVPPSWSLSQSERPLPGSFPEKQQYAYYQTPESNVGANSPSTKDSETASQPTLRLRKEPAPQLPPQYAPNLEDSYPRSAPSYQSPPIKIESRSAEKDMHTERTTPAEKLAETPTKSPAKDILNATDNSAATNTISSPPTQNLSNQPGKFCMGAVRLQQDRSLSIDDITRHDSYVGPGINPNSICQHCNLELDTNLQGQILPDKSKKNLIAMQHIMACASLVDPRAMFRCLRCAKMERDAEFRVVNELWTHLRTVHNGIGT